MATVPLWRRGLAEAVGTTLLVAAVVGSGIAAQRLSPGDAGLQLLENAAATAAALTAIILAVGPVSGAHLNPAVSLAGRMLGGLTTRELDRLHVGQPHVLRTHGVVQHGAEPAEPVGR
ncbi:MAG: aquaporin [Egibacteraceae bacterium]